MQLSLFYFSFRASTVTVPLIFAWDRWDLSDMMQHATDLLQSHEETSNRSYLGAVREAAKEHMATNAISSDELRKMFVQFNLVTNIMNALSKSFNFCSTGVCLLAMTVERYIFICHAMKAEMWLSKVRHTLLCVFSSTAILVGSTVTCLRELFSGNLTCELCNRSNQRLFMMWRVVETIIFFVTPASFCVFFFIKIVSSLRNMLTHQERNQQIIKALAVTYFSWILLWLPSLIFDFAVLFNRKYWDTTAILHYKFVRNLMDSLAMLYSTVTPLIFIVLVRSFHVPIQNLYARIRGRGGYAN